LMGVVESVPFQERRTLAAMPAALPEQHVQVQP
jgi:hypothetical protein